VFDLSIPKLRVLALIALVIFGPDKLPKIVSQAGRALRDLRRIADSAKNHLREGLGPEFAFEIEDLNLRGFVAQASRQPQWRPGPEGRRVSPGFPAGQGERDAARAR
jgi:TatA/E family protein of Tat protein translocase